MRDEPILEPMVDDPAGVVMWAGHRIARCGEHVKGGLDQGCCKKLFKFRGCTIDGRPVFATVCQICSLKYDVFNASLPAQCYKFADELAQRLGCNRSQAIDLSWDAFGFINPRKFKWGQAPKSKKNKKSRNPYADD